MKTEKVPYLTRRDCGELANNRPKLPAGELAHWLKRYWFEGMKQGQMAKATGKGKDYVKKFTACFSRALRPSPTGETERRNPEKQVQ